MPDDGRPTTWVPKRGRLFQILVWGLLGLIGSGVIAGLVIVLRG
jgi:hypothetical protein